MHFYVRHPSDPDWLADIAEFHGHLGPWVTVGAMIGRDALQRLQTRGYWEIEVVCWMPPEKQRPPFSCILDGLQAASGATLGKQNIRFADDPEMMHDDQPVVCVVRRSNENHPCKGLVYRVKDDLVTVMRTISPDRLEEISRQLAGRPVEAWFEIRPATKDELGLVAASP